MQASLEGVEARLTALGEEPHFAVVAPGRLQHRCSRFDAWVNFWPVTLRWNVEGVQSASVEAALLEPVPEDCQPSEACSKGVRRRRRRSP